MKDPREDFYDGWDGSNHAIRAQTSAAIYYRMNLHRGPVKVPDPDPQLQLPGMDQKPFELEPPSGTVYAGVDYEVHAEIDKEIEQAKAPPPRWFVLAFKILNFLKRFFPL